MKEIAKTPFKSLPEMSAANLDKPNVLDLTPDELKILEGVE
jgi:hypothetical protein